MLKTGTPRLTVQKLMMKALGDEGFLPELLNNWQEKLIHANSTVSFLELPDQTLVMFTGSRNGQATSMG